MTERAGAPILVGVDGSPTSLAAVTAAVREAAYRHRGLRIVHAFVWPLLHVPLGPAPGAPPDAGLRADAERILAEAEQHAKAADSGVPVTTALVTGAAAAVLLAQARDAAMVVLGDRGLGGFTGLLLGSVAVQVVAHTTTPVLVVRGTADPAGPIVVGVDGSPHADRALGFAFAEAAYRGAAVHAVRAWRHPVADHPGEMLPLVYDAAAVEAEEALGLAEALAGWSARYPEVSVRRDLVRARPAPALVDMSAHAQLVVVGARGRGGFAGLLLGSVSQAVLHHSACPVAVIRD